jgi:hypothetical protein
MSTTAKRRTPSPRSPIYCATADPDTHHRIGGKPARSGGAAASSKERGAGGGPVARSLLGCWDCSADTQGARASVTQRRAIIGDDDHDLPVEAGAGQGRAQP